MSVEVVYLYRCVNPKCKQGEFEATKPICPGCTVDGTIPRYARFIHQLEVIHFDAPDPLVDGLGVNTLACSPERSAYGFRFTGEWSVVNCRRCRETDVWKAAKAYGTIHAAANVPDIGGSVAIVDGRIKYIDDSKECC